MIRVTIKEYSSLKNISIPTIYKQIDKQIIKTVKEGRNVFILMDEGVQEQMQKCSGEVPAQLLNEKIKNLEELLKKEVEARERAENDKKELYKQLEQSNILQLKTLDALKQIEYKSEKVEEEFNKEKKQSWFEKIFSK